MCSADFVIFECSITNLTKCQVAVNRNNRKAISSYIGTIIKEIYGTTALTTRTCSIRGLISSMVEDMLFANILECSMVLALKLKPLMLIDGAGWVAVDECVISNPEDCLMSFVFDAYGIVELRGTSIISSSRT